MNKSCYLHQSLNKSYFINLHRKNNSFFANLRRINPTYFTNLHRKILSQRSSMNGRATFYGVLRTSRHPSEAGSIRYFLRIGLGTGLVYNCLELKGERLNTSKLVLKSVNTLQQVTIFLKK